MTDTLQSGAESALDLDKLEALARAATPGPWGADSNHGKCYIEPIGDNEPVASVCKLNQVSNAAFMAAANPAAVLDLIALARRATAPHASTDEQIERYRAALEEIAKRDSPQPTDIENEAQDGGCLYSTQVIALRALGRLDGDEWVPAVGSALVAVKDEQQHGHVMPPTRGTDSQHEAGASVLTNERIITIANAEFVGKFYSQDAIDFARAIEAELASRGRAQGGNTSDNGASESAAAPADLSQAASDVLAERRRQVEQEGWEPAHDDEYAKGELSIAAACYVLEGGARTAVPPVAWPWAVEWWKPSDERRNLVKAGALILADIERLDRATHQPATQAEGK